MAVLLSFLLILTGSTGIHGITTVSEVSVKAGESISIPCLYDSKYTNHVKYLCEGYRWSSCSIKVRTDQPNSEKFSISDDKNQRVFTVTMKDLTAQDTDFWCAVEIHYVSDDGVYFHMSVSRGMPGLSVDHQKVTAGENLIINCYYRNSGEMKWCMLGRSCEAGSSQTIDGIGVTIDKSVPNVFTVSMSGLTTENSGWYWCASGNLQMPVHVMVIEKPTTAPSTTPNHHSTALTTPDSHFTSNLPSDQLLMSFIIPLSLLVLAVMVTLFVWFLLKRCKYTKVEPTAPTMAEEEVTYSDVQYVRKHLHERSNAEMKSDVDVIYSSVVTVHTT